MAHFDNFLALFDKNNLAALVRAPGSGIGSGTAQTGGTGTRRALGSWSSPACDHTVHKLDLETSAKGAGTFNDVVKIPGIDR